MKFITFLLCQNLKNKEYKIKREHKTGEKKSIREREDVYFPDGRTDGRSQHNINNHTPKFTNAAFYKRFKRDQEER